MAFGDGLLNIENQLVDRQGLTNALSQTPPKVDTAALQILGGGPTAPTELQEPQFVLTPDNSKRLKGIGKFINGLTDVLSDSATQKALASIGIGLDPRGVGGVLGNLGISLAPYGS